MFYRLTNAAGGDYVTAEGTRVALMRCAVPAKKSDWKQYANEANAVKGFGLTLDPLPERDPAKDERIAELKQMLADTDYAGIKIGEKTGEAREALEAQYAELMVQRDAWREEIRSLQNNTSTETE